jgi:hypothetical protein
MYTTDPYVKRALGMTLGVCRWACRVVTRLWQAVRAREYERLKNTHETWFQAEVPCRGDAFSFRVTIRESWSRPGELESLRQVVGKRIEAQHMAMERRLRTISRRFPPDSAEVFERTMNMELDSMSCFPDDPGLCCEYSVRAAPDKDLREHLRNAEINRLEDHAKHEREEQQLNHLEVMRDRWLDFLRKFDGDPLGSLAAQLADSPEQLADAIEQRTSERERLTEGLRKLCDTATEAYRDKDVFDFVYSTDSALSRLLRHVGIDDVPGPGGKQAGEGGGTANGAHPPRT